MTDSTRLKESWAHVAGCGDEVPLFFYSYLFLRYPETRKMFPPSMAAQRDRLVGALGHIVADVDSLDTLVPYLEDLGRDHRRFGVQAEHYPLVGEALLATLEHFLGEAWTREMATDWHTAFALVSSVMAGAAEQAAATTPAWWEAEIIGHERRTLDIAVITVQPEPLLDYLPGQSLTLETSLRPRMWRLYSPANAPREDGTIELHVRAIDGGWVSSALVHAASVGEVVRLGPPVGQQLTLDPQSRRNLVLVAGGTGLAPLRALAEQALAEQDGARRVHLFVGARIEEDLYDLPTLNEMAAAHDGLTVVPVVSHQDTYAGERGMVGEVAAKHGPWDGCDIYVCGSPAMVAGTLDRFAGVGIGPERVRHEYSIEPIQPHDEGISTDAAPDPAGLLVSGGEHA